MAHGGAKRPPVGTVLEKCDEDSGVQLPAPEGEEGDEGGEEEENSPLMATYQALLNVARIARKAASREGLDASGARQYRRMIIEHATEKISEDRVTATSAFRTALNWKFETTARSSGDGGRKAARPHRRGDTDSEDSTSEESGTSSESEERPRKVRACPARLPARCG